MIINGTERATGARSQIQRWLNPTCVDRPGSSRWTPGRPGGATLHECDGGVFPIARTDAYLVRVTVARFRDNRQKKAMASERQTNARQPAQRQFSIIKCSSSIRLSIFFKSLRRPFSGLMSRVRHRMIISRRSRILLGGTWEPLF
jgi:hypothetical protein